MRYVVSERIDLPPLQKGDFPQVLQFHTSIRFGDDVYAISFRMYDTSDELYIEKIPIEVTIDEAGTTIVIGFELGDLLEADVYSWIMDYTSDTQKITLGYGKVQVNNSI